LNMSKVYTIAEIGQAHDGSLGLAHSYIDVLAETGVDAVKFQTHVAQAESSEYEPFRVNFSFEDKTRFDYWKRMEFTQEQWHGLKEHCDRVGLEFISSPFSIAAVELLEEVGVRQYKIGSGEVSNLLLLQRIAQTGKPIILSSGMSSYEELANAIIFLKPYGNPLTLLQCTTAYPTQPEQWGLNVMAELKERFQCPVGFSDHSGDIVACLAATSLGASVIEFHVVFDQRMFGPDAKASITPDKIKMLVSGVRKIEVALNNPVQKNETVQYNEIKNIFGKTLSINRSMKKGEVITLQVLESKKPAGKGIPASKFQEVLGKTLAHDLQQYSFLRLEDLV
jgi:N,N'-diacetyllegionaminate synthase